MANIGRENMKYVISKSGNLSDFLEISEVEFNEIKSANKKLLEALFIEEKLDFVVENYLEFENDLLRLASKNICFHNNYNFSRNNDQNLLNRRIMNLLSVSKSYLEQSKKHIKNLFGENSTIFNQLNDLHSAYYDKILGYRFMEALRNYVQHYDVPIHVIGYLHGFVDNNNIDAGLFHKVIPCIQIKELEKDEDFKSTILDELMCIFKDEKIDIREFIREYVESIGKIQEEIREMIKPDLLFWEEKFNLAFKKYQDIYSEKSLSSIAIIAIEEDQKWKERVPLLKSILERREEFELKNRQFNNLHLCFATNQL